MPLLGPYACHANKSVDPARVMFDVSFIDWLVIHADFVNRPLRLKRCVTPAVRIIRVCAFDANSDFSIITISTSLLQQLETFIRRYIGRTSTKMENKRQVYFWKVKVEQRRKIYKLSKYDKKRVHSLRNRFGRDCFNHRLRARNYRHDLFLLFIYLFR